MITEEFWKKKRKVSYCNIARQRMCLESGRRV